MKKRLFLVLTITVLSGIFISAIPCKTGGQAGWQPKSATELLTQGKWILNSYGFDDNKNNTIDIGEEMMQECDKDNTYMFNREGTGFYSDGKLICGNGIIENPFNWKFMEKGSALDFMSGIAGIFRLNEDELILTYEFDFCRAPVKFFTIYRH
jgi:hypothetical protein